MGISFLAKVVSGIRRRAFTKKSRAIRIRENMEDLRKEAEELAEREVMLAGLACEVVNQR